MTTLYTMVASFKGSSTPGRSVSEHQVSQGPSGGFAKTSWAKNRHPDPPLVLAKMRWSQKPVEWRNEPSPTPSAGFGDERNPPEEVGAVLRN